VTDNESTNEENLITFVEGATSSTGNVGLEMDGNLTYNPSTGTVTATGFSGNLTGTLQTAAQANVTSLGTLTTLTVDNVIINGTTIGHTDDTDLITLADGAATFAGKVNVVKDQNADSQIHLYNANTGTAAEANVYVTNTSATSTGLFLGATGSSFTTASGFVQDGAHIGSGSNASGGLSIMTRASAAMRFYTNGHTNERMRIDGAHGDVTIITSYSGSTKPFRVGYGSYASFTPTFEIDDSGDVDIKGDLTLYNPSNAPYIDFVENADTSDSKARIAMDQVDTNNGQLIFSTENAGTLTTALTINQTQNATFAGDVAINGALTSNIACTITGNSGYEDIMYIKAAGTNINSRINLIPTGTGDGVVNSTANELILQTGGTNALKITDAQQIELHGIAAADGYTLPYDQNPGYCNFSAGGFGFLFREAHDSYTTGNLYYYKTGGAASWRYKFGSAGAAIMAIDDGNIYFKNVGSGSADAVASLNEVLRLNTSGNMGLGTSTIRQRFHQHVADSGANYHAFTNTGTGTASTDGSVVGIDDAENLLLWQQENLDVRIGSAGSDRIRVKNDGKVCINLTGALNGAQFSLKGGSTIAGQQITSFHHPATSGTVYFMAFGTEASYTERGYITYDQTDVAFTQVSDVKLKKNIRDLQNGLDTILKIKPRVYDWKDGRKNNVVGFVAQEVEQIKPNWVKEKDGLKMLDTNLPNTIPYLIKAIQEQQDMIQELKAEIDELKKK